jgi:hypothetical protein
LPVHAVPERLRHDPFKILSSQVQRRTAPHSFLSLLRSGSKKRPQALPIYVLMDGPFHNFHLAMCIFLVPKFFALSTWNRSRVEHEQERPAQNNVDPNDRRTQYAPPSGGSISSHLQRPLAIPFSAALPSRPILSVPPTPSSWRYLRREPPSLTLVVQPGVS